jgi:hypothetical protein
MKYHHRIEEHIAVVLKIRSISGMRSLFVRIFSPTI